MLLIGAGQFRPARHASPFDLDPAVTVCDPREEWSEEWRQPGPCLTREMPDDVVIAMRPDARSAVIALTHDPKLDDLALMEGAALAGFLCGGAGSRRTTRRRARRRVDLTESQARRAARSGGLTSAVARRARSSIAAELVAVERAALERVLPRSEGAALEIAADTLKCSAGPPDGGAPGIPLAKSHGRLALLIPEGKGASYWLRWPMVVGAVLPVLGHGGRPCRNASR